MKLKNLFRLNFFLLTLYFLNAFARVDLLTEPLKATYHCIVILFNLKPLTLNLNLKKIKPLCFLITNTT